MRSLRETSLAIRLSELGVLVSRQRNHVSLGSKCKNVSVFCTVQHETQLGAFRGKEVGLLRLLTPNNVTSLKNVSFKECTCSSDIKLDIRLPIYSCFKSLQAGNEFYLLASEVKIRKHDN